MLLDAQNFISANKKNSLLTNEKEFNKMKRKTLITFKNRPVIIGSKLMNIYSLDF